MSRSQRDGLLRPSDPQQSIASRRGSAAVEFAVILPVLVLLILGAVEVGRAIVVQQSLVTAARAGARVYAVKVDTTDADVYNIVDAAMADANITGYSVNLDEPAKVDYLDAVSVSVSVPYKDIAWLPGTYLFMSNTTLTGTCVMPADTGNPGDDDD